MVTRKKSKSEPKRVAKKVREPKVRANKAEQSPAACAVSDCVKAAPQDAKQFFSELLAIYGNKYYILLLGAAVGFTAGIVVDHLFIKG
jgi:hypothetical protein